MGALHLGSLKGSYKQALSFQPCKTSSEGLTAISSGRSSSGTHGRQALPSAHLDLREVLRNVGGTLERKEGTSMRQIVTRLLFFLGRH